MPTEYRFEDLDLREEPAREDNDRIGFSGSLCETNRCPTIACTECCCTTSC
jgi:hypothetical protein